MDFYAFMIYKVVSAILQTLSGEYTLTRGLIFWLAVSDILHINPRYIGQGIIFEISDK